MLPEKSIFCSQSDNQVEGNRKPAAYPENPSIIFAYPDHLYPAVQGQEDGDGGRPPVSGIDAFVQVDTADPVAVPDLGGAKHGAQLGQRVEGDGPVAQDTSLADSWQQEDLLHTRARTIEATGGFGI